MNKLFLYLLSLIFILGGCSDSEVGPAMPNVVVSEQIPVNSLQYPALRQDGGYVYLNSGYKGIIIFRENANSYIAFERACPYDPTASCSLVEMDQSLLFFIDKCCKSQFNFQGGVMAGPAVYGLKRYQTALSGNLLYITN